MIAITRDVSPAIGACELTFRDRSAIDPDRARRQLEAYRAELRRLGVGVMTLPATPDQPDSVFVEDTAVVLDELAVATRPGAASRRPEVESVARILAQHRPLHGIEPPGTLEGGDVLRIGRTLYVGRSRRTNAEGIRQLRRVVAPYGYTVREVTVSGCLHLKTGCTDAGSGTVLINTDWVDAAPFAAFDLLEVPPHEPWAASVLRVGDTLLMPASHPATAQRLRRAGFSVRTVEISEFEKAEGRVTCLSIVMEGASTTAVDSAGAGMPA